MAQRRMFSLKVVDTDMFLAMPISSRLLYYDLSMRADDDGFVDSPKKILKMIGCSEDDLKILISKQYIIPFETGVCVIKHWNIHNLIRHDRYNETECKTEKKMLKKIDNKYEIVGTQNVIPIGNPGKVRLGKVRIDKDIYGTLNNVELTKDQYNKLTEEYGLDKINIYIDRLSTYIPNRTKQPYKDHCAVLRTWLREDALKKQQQPPVLSEKPKMSESERLRLKQEMDEVMNRPTGNALLDLHLQQ